MCSSINFLSQTRRIMQRYINVSMIVIIISDVYVYNIYVQGNNSNKRVKIAYWTKRFHHFDADWSFAISIHASRARSLLNPTRCVSCTERDWQRQHRDRPCIYVDGNARAFMRARTRPRPTRVLMTGGDRCAWFRPGLLGWFFRPEHFRCFRQCHGDDDCDERRLSTRASQLPTELTRRLLDIFDLVHGK